MSATTPLPSKHPQIVWRAGLDLNPLDVTDEEDVAWLEHLVWPEHRDRLARLRAVIAVARHSPPPVTRGDLREDLSAVIAQAPPGATVVVFHTAVLSYIPSQRERDDFAAMMSDANVIWLSNEAAGVSPQFSDQAGRPADGMFLLTRNGSTLALTGPHGQSVHWIGNADAKAE